MEALLPLWVEGRLVWITGLTKRTTCSDVIASVIHFQRGKSDGIHEKWQYKVIERWRWMERHLPGRCKVLKVWQSWGEERKNVYFLMKKRSTKSENSSKEKKYTKIKMPRSRHSYKSHRRFKMKNDHHIFDREQLKSILAMQQNALEIQKEKLALRESEIEEYEALTHFSRIKQSGENYLQDLYLGNEDHLSLHPQKKADPLPNLSDDTVREATLLYERILEMSKRIEKQEQNIRLLSAQIRHSVSVNDPFEVSNNSFANQSNRDPFVISLQKTKIRAECLAAVNETQRLAMEHNERTLEECDRILSQKKNSLALLHKDLYRADEELNNIQQGNVAYNGHVEEWQSAFEISRDDVVLIDNSSDTGLSSLQSSCEDNGYIVSEKNSNFLDTLV